MKRRTLAMAASFAVVTLLGVQPATAATQCVQACDNAYQQCSGSSGTNNQACLPKWGQCKKACAGPVATKAAPAAKPAATPVKTAPAPAKAKVTKVASTAKPPGPSNKAKPGN